MIGPIYANRSEDWRFARGHFHRPAHVHVIGHGHEAVFTLNDSTASVAIRENYGFSARDLTHILGVLEENLAALLSAWEVFHGIR
jgi:hypothetical protein